MPTTMPSQRDRDQTKIQQSKSQRKPLHQRSESEANLNTRADVRLVPKTPPRLLDINDNGDAYFYTQTPLPTLPSHILIPRKQATENFASDQKISEFQDPSKRSSPLNSPCGLNASSTPINGARAISKTRPRNHALLISTGSPSSRPSIKTRQLRIHEDSKTFSLCSPKDDKRSLEEVTSQEENVMSTSPYSLYSSSKTSDQIASSLGAGIVKNDQATKTPELSNSSCTSQSRDITVSKTTPLSDNFKKQITKNSKNSLSCNYEFVGGLRKVAETPNHILPKSAPLKNLTSLQLPVEVSSSTVPQELSSKPSFSSSNSTSSETTNYKTYGNSSPSNSSHSLVSQSPLPASRNPFTLENPIPVLDPETNKPASGRDIESQEVSRDFIQFSNVLANQQTSKSHSFAFSPPLEQILESNLSRQIAKSPSRSKESPHSDSSESFSSSSFTPEEAIRGFFSTSSSVQVPFQSFKLNPRQTGLSSWAESLSLYPLRSHMNEYPHQWSSQLSTVLSVSEGGSEQDAASWTERSRNSISSRSRVMSIGSGLSSQELSSPISRSLSWNESRIDMPQTSLAARPRRNSSSSVRMVVEPDEYGDGITDLQNMRVRPMRRRTSGYFSSNSSENGRTNTMRSSISTNSISLNLALIPAWARLYYGGGEQGLILSSRSSTGGLDSRQNSFRASSPRYDNNISTTRNSRKLFSGLYSNETKAKLSPTGAPLKLHRSNSMPYATWNIANLWSPHLRPDKRSRRACMWGPPSVDFSDDSGVFGRRNIQVVMFILGFIFPFSWMIASILPLPPSPVVEMQNDDRTSPTLDIFKNERDFNAIDEARYENAAWWRKLNRWMSLVGVLVIGAVVALVIIGLEQGWGIEEG
ncbi:putative serine-rich protein [Golovinomyces cichoracearum]|uniref:Putative serine-rich protein n=1 Tax=Golovinomyces cichoracearum TaxID=62708 RepID=A0A420HCN4_9PEZI|nr:putative serine-rich protein [Golovinomyces cichoracearum]